MFCLIIEEEFFLIKRLFVHRRDYINIGHNDLKIGGYSLKIEKLIFNLIEIILISATTILKIGKIVQNGKADF